MNLVAKHWLGWLGHLRWQWPSSAPPAAVVPGDAATPEVLGHEETRQAMIALVGRFAAVGLSWRAGEPAKITHTTQKASEDFLRALPSGKAFPKISPDGEGGLMMVWEASGRPFVLTIDDRRLHGVIAAGTPQSEYIDDMPLDSVQLIPDKILDAIPAR